ncbi:MAG TPA: histidine--tRNA ligase [Gemmataceae bacterium]|nr:histidine--tRNA ligase [Gemmataceae bacterium]
MADLIQPRTLKGFRDYPPVLMMPRELLLEQARRVYRSYGFAPIDTPALEYTEILLGKGGDETDKQLYRFTDHGGRDVALRFDLTVPFARFAAEHIGKLGTPFKRYHMGPVWRGENTQRGRYREFWQCDFDTIGTTSNAEDIETVLVINDLFEAIGFKRFEIRINNRLILNGYLEQHGLAHKAVAILRALDKLPKMGRESVIHEMVQEAGIPYEKAHTVVWLAEVPEATGTDVNEKTLLLVLQSYARDNEKIKEGALRLKELLKATKTAGVPEDRIRIDLSIARGLDYYTGTIFETFLTDLPGIGSVCSGGRYDNLASLYTKLVLPGVGASLGLDRLLAAMEELKMLPATATPAPVLMVQFAADRLGAYQKMARALRAGGIGVEVYPEPKKVGQQLQYAERRGFALALIAGPDEFEKGVWKIKHLAKREEQTIAAGEVLETIRAML